MPSITVSLDDGEVIEIIEVPMDAVNADAIDIDSVIWETKEALNRTINIQADRNQLASARRHRKEFDAGGGFRMGSKEIPKKD